METTPATQGYIFSPDNPVYHLARSESMTLCGLWLHGKLEQRKRRGDLSLSPEKPVRQFAALCSECDRKVTGAPKPKSPSPELLTPSRFIDIPI
jgi:hypothetical protein